MDQRVARQGKTRKRRQVRREERRREQRRAQAAIDARIAEAVREVIEQALQDEVTGLLGRRKGERRDLTDTTEVAASCNRCGTNSRRCFFRAGSYERGLLTFEVWSPLAVPRVSCACGGMVDVEFVHLVPYGRRWFDVEERARELAGLCVSVRDGVEVLAWRNGQPVSIATMTRLVQETTALVTAFRAERIARVPAVVMLDGLWVTVLEPTGERYVDRQGRKRERVRRRKVPVLVAYGVDPVRGERWLLDWEQGREEDEASWRKLLERLLARGLSAERGLELFVHDGSAGLEQALGLVHFGRQVERQRCIFHKLRNVGRDVVGDAEMSRKERQQRRADVVAAAVYRGKDEAEIRQRLAEFRAKWGAREPKATATLERDFDRTLVYLRVRDRAACRGLVYRVECLRATSALERIQRHFRQKARQVVIFHSTRGIDVAIYLVMSHHRLAAPSTEPWPHVLEEALAAA